jgi:hypothetical protein
VHSNVNPLSRLPQKPPDFIGPKGNLTTPIKLETVPAEMAWQPGGERVNKNLVATAAATEATHLQPPQEKKGVPAEQLTYLETGQKKTAEFSKPLVPEILPAPALAFNKPPTNKFFTPKEVLCKLENSPTAPISPTDGKNKCVKEWELDRPLLYLHVSMDLAMRNDWVQAYQNNCVLLRQWSSPDADAKVY